MFRNAGGDQVLELRQVQPAARHGDVPSKPIVGEVPKNASVTYQYFVGTVRADPYLALFSSAALGLTILGFNLLGDGLRDLLDPRVAER